MLPRTTIARPEGSLVHIGSPCFPRQRARKDSPTNKTGRETRWRGELKVTFIAFLLINKMMSYRKEGARLATVQGDGAERFPSKHLTPGEEVAGRAILARARSIRAFRGLFEAKRAPQKRP